MKPTSQELVQRNEEDRAAAGRLLRSPDGERLLRFLTGRFVRRGLGADQREDAYRIAGHDLVDELEAIRDEPVTP